MTRKPAHAALALLVAMNLLNYADRYVPSAMKDLFKRDLRLTDTETSLPLTAFVLVFIVSSPLFGALADRYSRTRLLAAAALLWSLATAAAALAHGFASFFAARAAVGIGEAAYATIAPTLISDLFPPARRNRALAIFYLAIPLGSAIGFSVGGLVAARWGWRAAFLIFGLPGLVAAGLALLLDEPERGRYDKRPRQKARWRDALKAMVENPTFLLTVAGYAMVMFAAGAIADWFPTFLERKRHFTTAGAGMFVGTLVVIGGVSGTLLGSVAADRLAVHRTRNPYLAFSAIAMVPATILACLCVVLESHVAIGVCLVVGQFFAWSYNGPINTLLVGSVPSEVRARVFSVTILVTHLFGDALSPPLVGYISDHLGGLYAGMALGPLALGLGTVLWFIGWRQLERPD